MRLLLRLTSQIPLLAACLLGFGCGCSADKAAAPKAAEASLPDNLSVEQFDRLRASPNAVVLDVRTPREFAAGHIPGAINIDWYGADFEARVAALGKSKTLLVHCATGRRSAAACAKLRARPDLGRCHNLVGGFQAWKAAGKPVQK